MSTRATKNGRTLKGAAVSHSADDDTTTMLTRGAAAAALGVSIAMIRKWERSSTLQPIVISGVHYHAAHDIELFRSRRQGRPIRLKDEHTTAASVFDAIAAGTPAVKVVRDLRVHPDVVEGLVSQFHRMNGALVIEPSALERLAAATGAVRIGSAAELLAAIEGAKATARDVPCGRCHRESARWCSECAPSRSASRRS